jgi:hypothetical protein
MVLNERITIDTGHGVFSKYSETLTLKAAKLRRAIFSGFFALPYSDILARPQA